MKKMMILGFIVLIGVFVLIFSGNLGLNKNEKANLVNSDEFENLMNEENIFVIQAHTPYQEEIEGTNLITEDWENIESYLSELPQDKNTKILVYCRSGRMSAISAQQLIDLGYKNVYDLEGGMKAWEGGGRNLISR